MNRELALPPHMRSLAQVLGRPLAVAASILAAGVVGVVWLLGRVLEAMED